MASVFNLRRTMISAGDEAEARTTGGGAHVLQDMGTILRERREAMGISLPETEAATRIRQKYLSALENNEWALLPGEVVGRGFLRNYSSYLGLDPTEMMERRRAAIDPRLAASLTDISSGAKLPPVRKVDYRPMNVDLKDEPEAIQARDIRLRPIFGALGVVAVLLLLGWGAVNVGDDVVRALANLPQRIAQLGAGPEASFDVEEPLVTPIVQATNGNGSVRAVGPIAARVQNSPTPASVASADSGVTAGNNNTGSGNDGDDGVASATAGEAGNEENADGSESTNNAAVVDENVTDANPADNPDEAVPTPEPVESTPEAAPEAVVDEPTPEPTPTFTALPPTPEPPTPEPLPTETPVPPPPEPEPVVAAAPPAQCADPGTQIFSPGQGQVVSGALGVVGSAVNPIFQEYKLEYAPAGTEAFAWFTGARAQAENSFLGSLDTLAIPNGSYTIRLTVVDNTGNFPPPCNVTVTVQN